MKKLILTLFVCLMCAVASNAADITWQGTTDAWETGSNWSSSSVPTASDNVIIPAGCTVYPTATSSSQCDKIFIAAGARLGGQNLLQYNEAFVEVTVPMGKYVRLTSPLQNTYTGDYFTYWQCHEADGSWGMFEESSFAGATEKKDANGGDWYNRNGNTSSNMDNAGGATYISMFVDASEEEDYYTYTDVVVNSATSDWQSPRNGLGRALAPAEGFDVWVAGPSRNTTFHFPAGDAEYSYYQQNGNIAPTKATTTRDAGHGKFAFTPNVTAPGEMDVRFQHEERVAMYAVGNPSVAYMDVKKFMQKNVNDGNIVPYIYRHNAGGTGHGTEDIYYYNNVSNSLHKVSAVNINSQYGASHPPTGIENVENVYFDPAEGFRVMKGTNKLYCVEPALIGNYDDNNTHYQYDGVRLKKRVWDAALWILGRWADVESPMADKLPTDWGSNIMVAGGLESRGIPTVYDFSMSIVASDDPEYVYLANFVDRGYVKAHVDVTAHTLTIDRGTPVYYIGQWDNHPQPNLLIYGIDAQAVEEGMIRTTPVNDDVMINKYELDMFEYVQASARSGWGGFLNTTLRGYSYRVKKELLNKDVVLAYNIDAAGTISLKLKNMFALYTQNFATANLSYDDGRSNASNCASTGISNGLRVWGDQESKPVNLEDCEAFLVYRYFSSSKTTNTGSSFINNNLLGKYKSEVSVVTQALAEVSVGDFTGIEIARVNGSYDNVLIKGLFPNSNTQVVGHITENGDSYRLTINGAQVVKTGTLLGDYYFIYCGITKEYNADDLTYQDLGGQIIMDWDNNNQVWTQNGNGFAQVTHANELASYCSSGFVIAVNNNNRLVSSTDFDGFMLGLPTNGNHFKLTRTGDLDPTNNVSSIIDPVEGLELAYTADMFVANQPAPANPAPSRANSRPEGIMCISAQANDQVVSTLIMESNKAINNFSRLEDAPLFDVQNADLCLGTLAGTQLVGVNKLHHIDTVPLYLTKSATLTFEGVSSMGYTISLYDAAEGTLRELHDGDTYQANIISGEEAGRYFIVGAPEVITSTEQIDSWNALAYSPAKGMLVVRTESEATVCIYNMAGQLIATENNKQQYQFEGLETGVYAVSAEGRGNQKQMKVIVY